MSTKRIMTILLCICIFVGSLPIEAFATTSTEQKEKNKNVSEETHTFGELNGYLAGNAITTTNLFVEQQFSQPGGHGFAAEQGNNLIDKMKGTNSSVVGGDNVANGPDRKIINRDGSITWIQDKYYNSARASVDSAFDETTGLYRYIDGDGKPMQLEVPADQYEDAVNRFKNKIESGKVPGVSNPDEAESIIRKGNLTFEQAKNIAKAGTVDSLKYDAVNGVITASCAAGIGFVLDFTCCMLNGASAEDALKNASLNGLKTGGIVFATYVISSQLSRTGVANALVPTAEAIAKALGDDVCEAIVLKAGVQTAGMSSTKAAAKIIAKELMVDGVMLVVLTGADVVELFRGRISEEELLKNLTVTIISIGVGTAGGYGGAALGTLIAPGLGTTIGTIIGATAAGGLSVWAAESLIAPYYESDAEEMFNIISDEFTLLCGNYLINENEGNKLVDELNSVLIGDVLKDMYASEDRNKFAKELIEPLFIEAVKNRDKIITPTEDELRYSMKENLQGIVFIH